MNTCNCTSTITYLDGDKGQLLYRGIPIEQLAEKSDYLESAFLVLFGELPTGVSVNVPTGASERASKPLLFSLAPSLTLDPSSSPIGPCLPSQEQKNSFNSNVMKHTVIHEVRVWLWLLLLVGQCALLQTRVVHNVIASLCLTKRPNVSLRFHLSISRVHARSFDDEYRT